MKIRKAEKRDLRAIAKIYRQVYSEKPYNEKWPDKYLITRINEIFHQMKSYVAEIKGQIVGFIFFYDYMWAKGRRGYISDLGVINKFRGMGIATKLMKKAEDILKKRGVERIKLNVYTDATSALRLYQKLEYKKTREVKMEKRLK